MRVNIYAICGARALVERSKTTFDPDNDLEHLELLDALWLTFHDNVRGCKKAFERTSLDWLKIGFQNADPASDVRGGGVLAVENMLAFIRAAPDTAIAMAESGEHDDDSDIMTATYMPWATAGVNITRLLLQLFGAVGPAGNELDASKVKKRYWPLVFEFDALYVLSFELLDATFDEEHGTYMSFPHVKDTVAKRLEAALARFGPAPASRSDDDFLSVEPDEQFVDRPAHVSELPDLLEFHYHPKQLPEEEKAHQGRAAPGPEAVGARRARGRAAPRDVARRQRGPEEGEVASPLRETDAGPWPPQQLRAAAAPADDARPGVFSKLFRKVTRTSSAGPALAAAAAEAAEPEPESPVVVEMSPEAPARKSGTA
ncbi:ELMO domain-containing protein [Aureococcus anophagefferens]|nr:ELMO domain-containing protein [Aureococcus anophagefferens]